MAQRTPQLTWQGYITGGADLYIRGRSVDPQGRTTGAVDRPRVSFRNPLPEAGQQVELEVRRGRGQVDIVEQPAADNEFSAIVRITPPETEPELYVLDFYWDATLADASRAAARNEAREAKARGRGEMSWTGSVDQEGIVEIQDKKATVRTVRGEPVFSAEPRFSAPLPRQSVTVRLEAVKGRGRVDVTEQPSAANDYTARVRISDDADGAGQYSFRLVWESSRAAGTNP